ncbi:hypothetical protein [Sphingomonas sp. 8AM]|uniref:hypothetical protein n=1 Tax=Sphingomonas sp. 8AM TaxID=2653170 RepID=UPI0012F28930|nr:hypothetical protein [Sphingomonas sp. 8AM]VXC58799.1 conserved exported hypothetical protein [Sphingomonas sp. 8AM]
MRIATATTLFATTLLTATSAAAQTAYPVIPEPMIFDMMRPLGAHKGEMEVNALAMTTSPFRPRVAEWAPEVEYAFADGMAVEFELPFNGAKLEAFKLGLQAAFGASADGRSAHGVQYLGIYDRETGRYSNSLLYMAGHRFTARWSMMNMVGVDDIALRRRNGRNALLLNHATFYDVTAGTIAGVELNVAGGRERLVRVAPQLHQRLAARVNVQAAAGLEKHRHHRARPTLGVRLVREL